jgi:nucleoside-diphosphate-sugar epimerase
MSQQRDLIVITGAGGFIGGNLAKYFHDRGFVNIRAVDKKPLEEWYQRLPEVENLRFECTEGACARNLTPTLPWPSAALESIPLAQTWRVFHNITPSTITLDQIPQLT